MKTLFIWFLLILVAWLSWQVQFANLHVAEADIHNAQMHKAVREMSYIRVEIPHVYPYEELRDFCLYEFPAQERALKHAET